MGTPSNKKYNKENIIEYINNTYPELKVLEVEESCEINKFKPRVKFTNGYEVKFAYFDNIRRGKFKFSMYTPEYIKNFLENNFKVKIKNLKPLDDKYNSFTKYEITTSKNKTIITNWTYILVSHKNNTNIFNDKRKEAWTEKEVYKFLSNKDYGLSNIKIEYDKTKPFNVVKCIIHFTYDKVEMNCLFRTLRSVLYTGDSSYLNLERGEKFYKNLLKDKFGIENIGFDRLYKCTTKSGKQTYMADIYNIEDGTKVKGVLTDNLKKRGYYFRSFQGEVMIENFLNEFKITYEKQKSFEGCQSVNYLRFDFYLPDYNTCIEYDGEFHFMAFDFTGGEKGLKAQQKRDKIKNTFCKDNEIKLIRIPYFKKDDIKNIIQDIVLSN